MAYTVAARIATHQALLDLLSTGSGAARFELYGGATLLATLPLDHATSEVDVTTGLLTLAPGAPAAAVASGSVTGALLIGRDDTVIDDGIAVEEGVNPVLGRLVLSSLNVITGGSVTLVAASIG